MEAVHENPFETLSELELNSDNVADMLSDREIRAELRFSSDEIGVGGYDITVSLIKATLHLEAWGSSIAPGTRLAERSRLEETHKQRMRRTLTKTRALKEAASAKAGVFDSSIGGSTEKEDGSEDTAELEIEREISNNFVKPTSGNRWIISEGSNGTATATLDGTYIANDVLCVLKPNKHANTISATATVVARSSDIHVEVQGTPLQRELRERLHKNRFHTAIVAKCLDEYRGQSDREKQRGRLILSRSTLEFDPDVS